MADSLQVACSFRAGQEFYEISTRISAVSEELFDSARPQS